MSAGVERWHGTPGGTTNHRCKCTACKAAWTLYTLKRRKERASVITPQDPRHGTSSFYLNHGCRCDQCKKAHTDTRRAQRNRRKGDLL